jgi:hypothetical protein
MHDNCKFGYTRSDGQLGVKVVLTTRESENSKIFYFLIRMFMNSNRLALYLALWLWSRDLWK